MRKKINHNYWQKEGLQKKFNNPNLVLENYRRVGPASSILDIGCGYGRTLSELLENNYRNLNGIDSSAEMIKLARKKTQLSDDILKVGSAINLSYANNKFDAVLLFAVLNCLPHEDVAALAEAKRVVRPGGYILINDFIASENILNSCCYEVDEYGPFAIIDAGNNFRKRHTTAERARSMSLGMKIVSWRIVDEISMNGNPAKLLSYVIQKKRCPQSPSVN